MGQGYHRKIVLASQSTQNTIYRSVPPLTEDNTRADQQGAAVVRCWVTLVDRKRVHSGRLERRIAVTHTVCYQVHR